MRFWEVGGCIRDDLMGIPTKDIDFAVEISSFSALRDVLVSEGFTIHQERPEFTTIRCGVPDGHPLLARTKDADFVMCRKDGFSSDGRRPDFVEVGSLLDDLARRDFTCNAIARDGESGLMIDPHGGADDIEARKLRFVGVPEERITEDGLRVLRGFRFMVTKGFTADAATLTALLSPLATHMLSLIPVERIDIELSKMLKHDTLATLDILCHLMGPEMLEVIFRDGLRLTSTLAQ